MDIVLIFNGLGNQMSQYAFYLAKKKFSPNVKCLYWTSNASHNGYELDRIFGIKLSSDIPRYIQKIIPWLLKDRFINKIIKKILSYLYIIHIYNEQSDYRFDESKLQKGIGLINVYYGGWHSYKYVEQISDNIESLFQFNPQLLNDKTVKCSKLINNNSVSIHIRRGDYIGDLGFGGIANERYYSETLGKIDSEDKIYFIFTNDKEWVSNFNLQNSIIVDWNCASDSWQDMYLMSLCRYNIDANSTFSIWASLLNKNINKVIYIPDHFINKCKAIDFYPEDWNLVKI